ncbi:MAG TPA: NDP-sugar synthase [Vicinamibacterales bacterium]|nr:NDP-sugar synthase [Vicinamibacterales bacterium]
MAASDRAPRALLLAAGVGTRLRPLTHVRAKAAVPVNGEPLVRRAIRWLASHAIGDIVINLHHLPASVTAIVGEGRDLGVRVRYSWEHPVLGSAGGPRHALPLLAEDGASSFLIVNADTLTDVDIPSLLAAHEASHALVTMALVPNPRPEKYGGVTVSQGRVTGFTKPGTRGDSEGDFPLKAGATEAVGTYHFVGVQAVRPEAFAALADGVALDSVGWLYPRLMADSPDAVRAFVCDAAFADIGTPRDCLDTSLALAAREGSRLVSASASVAGSALVVRTALWDDVVVGAGASLRDCIVGDGARIPAGAAFERCAIVAADGRRPAGDERIEGGLLLRAWQDRS